MSNRDEALLQLQEIVRDDGNNLARYAWGVMRNHGVLAPERDVLQDVVAEAVLTATQIIRSSDGRVPASVDGLRVWVRKIVALKSLERLRRIVKERNRRASLDDCIGELVSDEWTDLLAEDELKNAVRNALGRLEKREQEVLEMSILEGATSARIGQTLELSPNAVRKIKMRALKTLRRRLEELGA